MKVLLVADTSFKGLPTGISSTIEGLSRSLKKLGVEPYVVDSRHFKKSLIRIPSYGSVARYSPNRFKKIYEKFHPDHVFLLTEGPIAHSARKYMIKANLPYYSGYFTEIKKYRKILTPKIPMWIFNKYIIPIYKDAKRIIVASKEMKARVATMGFGPSIRIIRKGVDETKFFYNREATSLSYLPRPLIVYLGRVEKEKNIEAFLDLELPGTKIVIGDGTYRKRFLRKYGDSAIFFPDTPYKSEILSQADVFCQPSRTETFGLTTIEAMRCGLPVAAYDELAPKSIIKQNITGYMSPDLQKAVFKALAIKDKEKIIQSSWYWNWDIAAEELLQVFQEKTP